MTPILGWKTWNKSTDRKTGINQLVEPKHTLKTKVICRVENCGRLSVTPQTSGLRVLMAYVYMYITIEVVIPQQDHKIRHVWNNNYMALHGPKNTVCAKQTLLFAVHHKSGPPNVHSQRPRDDQTSAFSPYCPSYTSLVKPHVSHNGIAIWNVVNTSYKPGKKHVTKHPLTWAKKIILCWWRTKTC